MLATKVWGCTPSGGREEAVGAEQGPGGAHHLPPPIPSQPRPLGMLAVKQREVVVFCWDLLNPLIFRIWGGRQFVISLPVFLFLPHLVPISDSGCYKFTLYHFGVTIMSVPETCQNKTSWEKPITKHGMSETFAKWNKQIFAPKTTFWSLRFTLLTCVLIRMAASSDMPFCATEEADLPGTSGAVSGFRCRGLEPQRWVVTHLLQHRSPELGPDSHGQGSCRVLTPQQH